ncbi:MAG: hypothetical protein RJA86_562 [Pseudomonadota bacterium]
MVSEDTQPSAIKAAIKAGVSAYVVMQQIRQAESRLNERKVVERAKGLLMQLRSMTEPEAYHAMRKIAMDRNIRIIDVAKKLLSMNELLA